MFYPFHIMNAARTSLLILVSIFLSCQMFHTMSISHASVLFLMLGSALAMVMAQPARAQQNKQQYVIMLKLTPRLLDDANWTEADNQAVSDHFLKLKALTEKGTVVLAGRTLNSGESRFGLVIVEVENEQEAREIMDTDPAVTSGVMTATLFPYRIALLRSEQPGN